MTEHSVLALYRLFFHFTTLLFLIIQSKRTTLNNNETQHINSLTRNEFSLLLWVKSNNFTRQWECLEQRDAEGRGCRVTLRTMVPSVRQSVHAYVRLTLTVWTWQLLPNHYDYVNLHETRQTCYLDKRMNPVAINMIKGQRTWSQCICTDVEITLWTR